MISRVCITCKTIDQVSTWDNKLLNKIVYGFKQTGLVQISLNEPNELFNHRSRLHKLCEIVMQSPSESSSIAAYVAQLETGAFKTWEGKKNSL